MKEKKESITRRKFLGNTAAIGAITTLGVAGLASACSNETTKNIVIPVPLDQAPDGPVLKAGLIGCGGRGTGAAQNFIDAGPNLEIHALADLFQDKIDDTRKKLKENKGMEVPEENCFLGFDAYQKVLDSGVDVVIIATPPHFRPEQLEAAVKAKKHVFMEKPVAVDPVGARSIMASAKKAEALGLSIVAGTQRRHQRDYLKTYEQIANGAIGDIVGANVYWNQSQLWYRDRQPEWSDMEFMIRDWVNWIWLSGDHITEQHVHNLDVVNWFSGKHPVKAVGFGARHRRVTGDQYDMFSVDFVFDNDFHMHSMCRQINGCTSNVSEYVRGTKGYSNCRNTIWTPEGTEKWKYEYPLDENGEQMKNVKISPYVQEHIDLVTSIRNNEPINEGKNVAISTMTAIMGRISAYTGKEVTWDEVMNSDLKLGPKTYELGKMDMEPHFPVPGSESKE